MPVASVIMSSRRACSCLLLCAGALVMAAPAAASAPVYKCLDNHLALVYTDLPCKDGEQIDVRAGDADPAAVAHLEHERDLLDQSAALRSQDERRAALGQGAYVPLAPEGAQGAQEAADYGPSYGYGYGYPAYLRRPPHHPRRHPQLHARGAAPKPPYHVPRH